MNLKNCITLIVCFVTVMSSAATSRGGQVVTRETREWARQTLQAEQSLKGVTARNTLAVLPFRNRSGQGELDPVQKGMALMLTTDLSQVPEVQVVERIRIQAVMEELGLGASGLVEPGSEPRLGKLLQARFLVGGDVTGTGESPLRARSRLLETPTSAVIGEPASEGSLTELFRIEKDLLFELIRLLKIELKPDEKAKLAKPCSTRNRALMALFRGIDASDRGEYVIAEEMYETALEEDPEICVAGDAIQELRDLGLVPVKKKSVNLLRSLRDSTSLTNQLTPKDELKKRFYPHDKPSTTTIDVVFPPPPGGVTPSKIK